MSAEQRQSIENGLWLCQTCGKLIDSDVDAFPAELLRDWKSTAERTALLGVGKTVGSSGMLTDEYYKTLKKFAPESSADFFFREGYEALRTAAPELLYEVKVEEGGISVVVRGRYGEPISIAFDPVFPDTPEGHAKKEEFARFLILGTPVELDETNIPVELLPEPIRSNLISKERGPFRLRLGPRRPRAFAVALVFRAEDGDFVELPYIEFGRNRFDGADDVILTNDQQRIPFRISLRLSPDRSATFDYSFTLEGKGFVWLAQALLLQRVISKGAVVLMRDLDDGTEHVATSVQAIPGKIENAGTMAELVDRILIIQKRTNVPMLIPARSYGTQSDLEQLRFIEFILKTGRQHRPPDSLGWIVQSEENVMLLRELINGQASLDFSIPGHVERLFDNVVPVGRMEVHCERVEIHPEDAEKLEILLGSDPPLPQQIRLKPAEGHQIEVRYPRWEPVTAEPAE